MSKKNRPVFRIKRNDEEGEFEVTAGGVVLYRIVDKQLELLLMLNRGKYEDFGGTVDSKDINIIDTISREVNEESNGLIQGESIKSRIKDLPYILSKTSKYIIYILEANEYEEKLTSEQFGDKEIHDDIYRTVHWVPIVEFLNPETIKNKLNFRLRNKELFNCLKRLDPVAEQIDSNQKVIYLF